MKQTSSLQAVMGAVTIAVLAGCAAGTGDYAIQAGGGSVPSVSQRDAGDLAFHHLKRAAEYRDLARRLEIEARLETSSSGPRSEQGARSLERAQALWALAEQAEEAAWQYRRQIPHGQVF